MEGEAVSGAQLIAQALRAQVRARGGDRQPAGRDSLQRANVRGPSHPDQRCRSPRGRTERARPAALWEGGKEVPPHSPGSGPAPVPPGQP